jgi:phosphoglucomutase
MKTYMTPTGFKYIGHAIDNTIGGSENFYFAFEESFGFLYGADLRDKDGHIGALLTIEMVDYYSRLGLSLVDVYDLIQKTYGYCEDYLMTTPVKEQRSPQLMVDILQGLCSEVSSVSVNDSQDVLTLEKALNLIDKGQVKWIKIHLSKGGFIAVRPSGTEPKLKFYFSIVDPSKMGVHKRFERYLKQVQGLLI